MIGQLRTFTQVKILEFVEGVSRQLSGICPNCQGRARKLMKCGYHCGHIFCGACAIYNPEEQPKTSIDAKFISCPGCFRELRLPTS